MKAVEVMDKIFMSVGDSLARLDITATLSAHVASSAKNRCFKCRTSAVEESGNIYDAILRLVCIVI